MVHKKTQFKKIIFIICDALRQISLDTSFKKRAVTPNIDRLKKTGVNFINAYTTITKTDPSITSIMSGNYPINNGLINHGLLISKKETHNTNKIKPLAEILKRNGYKTMAVDWLSRWHKSGYNYYSGSIGRFLPLNFGFNSDRLLRYLDYFKRLSVRIFKRDFFIRFYYCFFKNPYVPYDTADVVIQRGIKLLENNRLKKVFLYLHLWDAHEPHVRPFGIKSFLFDSVDDTYNAEIAFIDSQIGKLVKYLKKTKQFSKTLIIFTSDHGENFYETGSPFAHDCLYENVVKIPLFFSNPLLPKRNISGLVQNIDIFPTILDLLKIKHNKKIDGMSLVSMLKNKKSRIREFVYFEDILKENRALSFLRKTRRRGILSNGYKFIQTISGNKSDLLKIKPSKSLPIINEELYNLNNDPEEKHNLLNCKKKKYIDSIYSRLRMFLQNILVKNY